MRPSKSDSDLAKLAELQSRMQALEQRLSEVRDEVRQCLRPRRIEPWQ
jgi:hypothetical protein